MARHVIRLFCFASLALLAGCADPSKGAALNACRMRYWLDSTDRQAQLIPECMRARSYEADAACDPAADPDEWDQQVRTFAFDNPRCYRSIGSTARIATFLSPM